MASGTTSAGVIPIERGGTGGTTIPEACAALGTRPWRYFYVNSGKNVTVTFSAATRILAIAAIAGTESGMYIIYGYSSNSRFRAVKAHSSLVVTYGDGVGTMNFKNTGSAQIIIYFIFLNSPGYNYVTVGSEATNT